ncbi:uncharacterized protein LOC125436084 [Sphaerodactylus townsendi]|uniref:uncharacterized protein LOC125436084 n=1 Tax=Sphaerodactylus townsendi TaxID=933632 RepID=UPI00202657B1|nr:uncharacterized protein LOC125436084 [Sphaerodactylus townsendi]
MATCLVLLAHALREPASSTRHTNSLCPTEKVAACSIEQKGGGGGGLLGAASSRALRAGSARHCKPPLPHGEGRCLLHWAGRMGVAAPAACLVLLARTARASSTWHTKPLCPTEKAATCSVGQRGGGGLPAAVRASSAMHANPHCPTEKAATYCSIGQRGDRGSGSLPSAAGSHCSSQQHLAYETPLPHGEGSHLLRWTERGRRPACCRASQQCHACKPPLPHGEGSRLLHWAKRRPWQRQPA